MTYTDQHGTKYDRFDLPVRRVQGCKADKNHLGWVPWHHYRIWTGDIDLCLGYTADGRVVVRGSNGVERIHSTPVNKGDQIVNPNAHPWAD